MCIRKLKYRKNHHSSLKREVLSHIKHICDVFPAFCQAIITISKYIGFISSENFHFFFNNKEKLKHIFIFRIRF